MRKVCAIVLFLLLSAPAVLADSQDNAVFRTRMVPDSEVPAITAAGNSAAGTITIHVNRDQRGNVTEASVTFDIDYTVAAAVNFTG